jgi:hypothetical protein
MWWIYINGSLIILLCVYFLTIEIRHVVSDFWGHGLSAMIVLNTCSLLLNIYIVYLSMIDGMKVKHKDYYDRAT